MRWLAALLVLLIALPGPARGDDDAQAQARAHYEIALGLFKLGNYRGALQEFTAGYELARKPGFLLNVALTHRKLGDFASAAAAYRQFLAEAPADDPQRPEVEELVDELAAELRAHPPSPKAADGDAVAPAALPNAPPRLIATAPPRRRGRPALRIAGLTVGSAGLAGLGVGIAFAVLADGSARDLNRLDRTGGPFDPAKDAAYHTDRTVEAATLAVGGAAVATGVVLYLVGRR
jgi:tetratricopeptide (TPR) repeat protein